MHKRMKTLQGISAATGIALGVTCVYTEKVDEEIPHYLIKKSDVDAEIKRFDDAMKKARSVLNDILEGSNILFDSKNADGIVRAYQMMLEDVNIYKKAVSLVRTKLVNAEHAVSDAYGEYIDKLREKKMHFAEIAQDIIDVRNRILTSFVGEKGEFACSVGKKQPVVVVSKQLTPTMVMEIPRENVLAFVTEEGGLTTHASILARSFGVPIVFNVPVEEAIKCGDNVIVDGLIGKVIVNPDTATKKYYKNKLEKTSKVKTICALHKDEPPTTKHGQRVLLKINITTPEEIMLVKDINYDGVGLLRTEFLFAKSTEAPSEDEQFSLFKYVLERSQGKPITVRLLDIGGDKLPPYLHLPPQDNPELGVRGSRALDFFYDIYVAQMKAILRSSLYGDIRILYPMVSDINDLNSFKKVLDKAKSILKKEKKPFKDDIKEGVMIETPSAALMADRLLADSDFANIGSNDLLQYTLAASRGNVFVESRYHVMHPALIQLIEHIVKAGEKQKKEICICGEIACFEDFYPVLLSAGLTSFSVAVSKYEDIKCHLLGLSKPRTTLLKDFYAQDTKEEIDTFFAKQE